MYGDSRGQEKVLKTIRITRRQKEEIKRIKNYNKLIRDAIDEIINKNNVEKKG